MMTQVSSIITVVESCVEAGIGNRIARNRATTTPPAITSCLVSGMVEAFTATTSAIAASVAINPVKMAAKAGGRRGCTFIAGICSWMTLIRTLPEIE
jgi:hypothetical protein